MQALDIAFAGVARQAELVRAREVSARELVELCLARIEHLDPQLNAFRTVYAERALEEAAAVDDGSGAGDGAQLRGVPIAIKDDIDVADDVTAHGSDAHGPPAQSDCALVARLREAGAIVIGKTNVPELEVWPFTETEAWGQTRNPWDTTRVPGGSSGGTGAAVAAGLVPAGTGSDGAGSIRIPAAFNGLFGLKPQRDRVELAPYDEVWHGMSVLGFLTRSVADSALLLDAAAAKPFDRPLAEAAGSDPPKLRIALSTKVPPGFITRVSADVRGGVERTAQRLRELGHEVFERDPAYGAIGPTIVMRYLRGIADAAADIHDPERLERRTRGMARLGRLISDRRLAKARAAESKHAARINGIFEDADVLLTPVTTAPAVEVGRWQGRGALWTLNGAAALCPFTGIWNGTGQPAASVPAGFGERGLPLAAMLVGPPDGEPALVALASQLQRAHDWTRERPPLATA